MKKFLVYRRDQELYVDNRAVWCDAKTGFVYQPYQFTSNPRNFARDKYKFSIYGPYDETDFVRFRHDGGQRDKFVKHNISQLHPDDRQRVREARELFRADPRACLLRGLPYGSLQKTLKAIDPESWRVFGRGGGCGQ